eukprot:1951385-Karenia_brevis.AAC.1
MLHELWVAISCDLAYHTAWAAGRQCSRTLGLQVHLPACRVATALVVALVACIHADVEVAIVAGLATTPRCVVHWFGKQA